MDFLGIGSLEFLIVLIVALLVLGPVRVVQMARNAGKMIREFQRSASAITDAIDDLEVPSIDIGDEGRTVKSDKTTLEAKD